MVEDLSLDGKVRAEEVEAAAKRTGSQHYVTYMGILTRISVTIKGKGLHWDNVAELVGKPSYRSRIRKQVGGITLFNYPEAMTLLDKLGMPSLSEEEFLALLKERKALKARTTPQSPAKLADTARSRGNELSITDRISMLLANSEITGHYVAGVTQRVIKESADLYLVVEALNAILPYTVGIRVDYWLRTTDADYGKNTPRISSWFFDKSEKVRTRKELWNSDDTGWLMSPSGEYVRIAVGTYMERLAHLEELREHLGHPKGTPELIHDLESITRELGLEFERSGAGKTLVEYTRFKAIETFVARYLNLQAMAKPN